MKWIIFSIIWLIIVLTIVIFSLIFSLRSNYSPKVKNFLVGAIGVGLAFLGLPALFFGEIKGIKAMTFLAYLFMLLGCMIMIVVIDYPYYAYFRGSALMGLLIGILFVIIGIAGWVFKFYIPPDCVFPISWMIPIAGGIVIIVFSFFLPKKSDENK